MKFIVAAFVVALSFECAAQNPRNVTHKSIHDRLRSEWAIKTQPFTPVSREDGEAACKALRIIVPKESGVFAQGSRNAATKDWNYITAVNGTPVSTPEEFSMLVGSVEPGSTFKVEGRLVVPPIPGKKNRATWGTLNGVVLVRNSLTRAVDETQSETDQVEKYINIRSNSDDLRSPVRLRVNKASEKAVPRLMLDLLLENDEWVFPNSFKLSINDHLHELKVPAEAIIRKNTAEKTFEASTVDISDRPDIILDFLDADLDKPAIIRFEGKGAIEDRDIRASISGARHLIRIFYRDRFGE